MQEREITPEDLERVQQVIESGQQLSEEQMDAAWEAALRVPDGQRPDGWKPPSIRRLRPGTPPPDEPSALIEQPVPEVEDPAELAKLGPELEVPAPTTIEDALALLDRLNELRGTFGQGPAGRELALAITALEDVIMRTNRAFASHGGFLNVADCERIWLGRG